MCSEFLIYWEREEGQCYFISKFGKDIRGTHGGACLIRDIFLKLLTVL